MISIVVVLPGAIYSIAAIQYYGWDNGESGRAAPGKLPSSAEDKDN
jgi:hypothetical protein